jgi:hypothetical protein
MPFLSVRSLALALGCTLALGACANDPCPSRRFCGDDVMLPDASSTDAPVVPDAAPDDVPDLTPGKTVALEIEPASVTLTSRDGAVATQSFQLLAIDAAGQRTPVSHGVWSLDHDRVGRIDDDGVFRTHGTAGGDVHVEALLTSPDGVVLRARATIEVFLTRQFIAPSTSSREIANFDAPAIPDSGRAASVVYPLEGAVMPRNVPPPHVQWDQSVAGDVFRVRVSTPHVSVTAFVSSLDARYRVGWRVDPLAWRLIAESDPDAPVEFAVDRWELLSGRVYSGRPVRIRLANGNLYGAVYYWDVGPPGSNRSEITRISADSALRTVVVPNPPRPEGARSTCIACHSVSRDGRYLSAAIGNSNASVFDLTADLSRNPAPTLFPPEHADYLGSSFSPDNTRLVISGTQRGGAGFAMIDPFTGISVATTGLPSTPAASPSWSPDGHSIAFIDGVPDGAESVESGSLAVLPRIGPDAFGPPVVLHRGEDLAGAPEGGSADARPNWSPDARWIAFQHGPRNNSVDGVVPPGALYMVRSTGGAPRRLDRASGDSDSYWPTFAPFVTTERGPAARYYWLAFYSRRDYGNAHGGTRGTGRRQLWVTAIDPDAPEGTDPSSVPYWLPGQDPQTSNMGAMWAPEACRTNGNECRVSSECCSGECRMVPDSTVWRCVSPPPAACRRRGQTCGSAEDCCTGEGLTCTNNVCELPPPG